MTVQVLTQAREHIIAKTFDALRGVKKAIVHLYNSTSLSQRQQVFKKSKEEIIEIARNGAKLFNEYAAKTEGEFIFEYSPESFTGTEMEFARDICNEVIKIWKPTAEKKVIIKFDPLSRCLCRMRTSMPAKSSICARALSTDKIL